MDRRALLEQKRQQLNRELRQWAEESKLLKPGEFLYLTIAIAQAGEAVVAVATDSLPTTTKYRYEEQWILKEVDWQLLLNIPKMKAKHKAVIELLKAHNNEPISRDEIKRKLKLEWKPGFSHSINAALRKPFRYARRDDPSLPTFDIIDVDAESVPYPQRRIRLRKWVQVRIT